MSAHHSATSEVRVSAAYIQMAETKERAARRVETSIYLGRCGSATSASARPCTHSECGSEETAQKVTSSSYRCGSHS